MTSVRVHAGRRCRPGTPNSIFLETASWVTLPGRSIDIRPSGNRTARFRRGTWRFTIGPMDPFGMVLLAIGAFALLEVAAMNLRGEDRLARSRRSRRSPR